MFRVSARAWAKLRARGALPLSLPARDLMSEAVSHHTDFTAAFGDAYNSALVSAGVNSPSRSPDVVFCVAAGHEATLASEFVDIPPAVVGAMQDGAVVLGAGGDRSSLEFPQRLSESNTDSPTLSAVGCKVLWFESGRPKVICPFVSADAGRARPALPDFKNDGSLMELVKNDEPAAVVLLAPTNDFSLERLADRLGTAMPQVLQVASYFNPPAKVEGSSRTGGSGASGGRTFVGGGDWEMDATSSQLPVLANTAVGVACGGVGAKVTAPEMADVAVRLLSWTHRSGFWMSPELETELFVPTSKRLDDDSSNDSSDSNYSLSPNEVASVPVFLIPVMLFPTVNMPLRVFEPRYRLLIKECLENQRPFMLVHPQLSGEVGCLARVVAVDSMDDQGCSNIIVRGIQRCAIEPNSIQSDPGSCRFGLNYCNATALPEEIFRSSSNSGIADRGDNSEPTAEELASATKTALLMAKIERALPLLPLARAYCNVVGRGMHRTVDEAATALAAQLQADPVSFAFHYANWLATAGVSLLDSGRLLAQPSVLVILERLKDILEAHDAKNSK